jgi:hypothetical protein
MNLTEPGCAVDVPQNAAAPPSRSNMEWLAAT